ncbi:MAG: oligoribonuclease NrnB/cAMP/cGMP phosphodiesterase (DHH superfamily), partial [Planctomycetota bacterium]
MSSNPTLTIHYHRDFDGMVAGAILAQILSETKGDTVKLTSVNYDQRNDWDNFEAGKRFAIVDFHFHPRAEYWFDHHPTTFLTPEIRAAYEPSERWQWDEKSPSCPPLILRHAIEHWGYEAPERFKEMAKWSDVIDAARYESVDQAIFGDTAALRIARSLTVAPNPEWVDQLAEAMR